MHILLQLSGHLGHAHGGAEAVEILIVMTHDVNLVCALHDFPEGMSHHPGLHAGVLLHCLGPAPEELGLAADVYRHLVAAAAQGQVKACLGLCPQLAHALAVSHRNAHGERHGQAVGIGELPDLVQHLEFLSHSHIQALALQKHDVTVLRHTAHEAPVSLGPVVQLLVHRQQERRALCLRLPLDHLVIVVYLYEAKHCAAAHVLIPQMFKAGHILHIERHEGLLPRQGFYGLVENLKIPVPVHEDVFPFSPPHRPYNQPRPDICHIRVLLHRFPHQGLHTGIGPLQASLLIDNEDCLGQALHGIIQHNTEIAKHILEINIKAAGPVSAALPGKGSQAEP